MCGARAGASLASPEALESAPRTGRLSRFSCGSRRFGARLAPRGALRRRGVPRHSRVTRWGTQAGVIGTWRSAQPGARSVTVFVRSAGRASLPHEAGVSPAKPITSSKRPPGAVRPSSFPAVPAPSWMAPSSMGQKRPPS